ncbi:NADH-quinone oxidoreductase subunit M [Stackebrandtia nassauensis]|uniref:Proton-translocating NADH-quinone oxidoreductase, chain M n=1 Tax=Stackebrandtia nassauensis (strain DSM 44728 / CIP 108903 / NRRL B-16338 / NBRC 102104 / LLR-40K-21) TaxID=446470 RepID=D3PU49_STANL|nr:NADH-quinone oxidoreductase subunit M [Stackebrandtia nassauensis]ADD40995.1 proton-translocating NADH-quinone oxidoreductase, chain M [Stackebrandtia nassauensis DSM 44728]
MNSFPYLSAVIVVPLIGALITASVPKGKPKQAKAIALGFSLAVAAITVGAWASYDTGDTGMQLTEHYSWVPAWGLNLSFGMDGIALVMLALTALLTPIVILASWNDAHKRNQPTFFALILALQATMIGTFISTNVLLFYIFFEVMLVPMYFLIGSYGGKRRQYAAVKFFLYSLLGGMVLLAAIIGLWVTTGGVFDFATLTDGKHSIAEGTLQNWLFLGFFIAFAIKAPFFPFHTWLPDAGGAAPAGIAALLVGVMDKIGTFAILRYCLPLFPDASQLFAPLAIALALVGVIYGALVAIGQKDLRRLVAYTSIAHFGFIGVGIFAFTTESASGAVLYMVNHGLATGLLFIVVGMLATRRGSSDIADFGGAGKTLPLLAGTFFIAGLASLALPGTAPFVSEFLILLGTYSANKPVAVIATLGVILAAAYVLWMYQRTMQGTVNVKLDGVPAMKRDLNLREKLVVAPLIVGILALGVYPQPVLDVINPAVEHTLDSVGVTGSADQAATGENK